MARPARDPVTTEALASPPRCDPITTWKIPSRPATTRPRPGSARAPAAWRPSAPASAAVIGVPELGAAHRPCAVVTTTFSEPALDRLHVDTKGGLDSVNVTGSTHQLIGFSFTQ